MRAKASKKANLTITSNTCPVDPGHQPVTQQPDESWLCGVCGSVRMKPVRSSDFFRPKPAS